MATKSQENTYVVNHYYVHCGSSIFQLLTRLFYLPKKELLFYHIASLACLASLAIFLAMVLASANVSALLKASLAFQARAIF